MWVGVCLLLVLSCLLTVLDVVTYIVLGLGTDLLLMLGVLSCIRVAWLLLIIKIELHLHQCLLSNLYLELFLIQRLWEDLLAQVLNVNLAGLHIHGWPFVVHLCMFPLLLSIGRVQRVECRLSVLQVAPRRRDIVALHGVLGVLRVTKDVSLVGGWLDLELALDVLRDTWRPWEGHHLTSELVWVDGDLANALSHQMVLEWVLAIDAAPCVVRVIPLSGDTTVIHSLFWVLRPFSLGWKLLPPALGVLNSTSFTCDLKTSLNSLEVRCLYTVFHLVLLLNWVSLVHLFLRRLLINWERLGVISSIIAHVVLVRDPIIRTVLGRTNEWLGILLLMRVVPHYLLL